MNHYNCWIHVGRFKINFGVLKETNWSWFWGCWLLRLSLGLWWLLLLQVVLLSHLGLLLFLRWAWEYWHGCFIWSVAVVVTKHTVLVIGVTICNLHFIIGNRFSSWPIWTRCIHFHEWY